MYSPYLLNSSLCHLSLGPRIVALSVTLYPSGTRLETCRVRLCHLDVPGKSYEIPRGLILGNDDGSTTLLNGLFCPVPVPPSHRREICSGPQRGNDRIRRKRLSEKTRKTVEFTQLRPSEYNRKRPRWHDSALVWKGDTGRFKIGR